LSLDPVREEFFYIFEIPLNAIVYNHSPGLESIQTIKPLNVSLVVDAYLICITIDHLFSIYLRWTHAQVGDCTPVSFLAVI